MVRKGYKQTEIGVIPEDWEVFNLSEVTSLDVGYAFKSSWYQKGSGVPLLRGENVGYGQPDWSDTRGLPYEQANSFTNYQLSPGEIVIGMDRTFTKSGAKISLLQKKDCPCLLVQRVGKFIPLKCNASFLWALLSSSKFQQALQLEQKGMDIPHLSRSEILKPQVALPPTEVEQEKIANTLSDLDSLISALDKLIAKKRHIKTATMQQLLTGKKRLPGFGEGKGYKQTEVGVVPEDWEVYAVEELGKVIRGASPRPKGDKRYYGGRVPRLMVEDVTRDGKFVTPLVDFLTEEGAKRSRPCSKGTLTLVCSGTVGVPSFLAVDACIHDGFLALVAFKKKVNDDFLYHFLKTQQDRFDNSATHGGVFTNLTTEILKNFRVPLPSELEEQQAIATALSDSDIEITALEARRTKTQAIKQGMMQELLTGRTRLV